MSYQVCPFCKGIKSKEVCEVCNDTKIISELTGLPPNTITQNITTTPVWNQPYFIYEYNKSPDYYNSQSFYNTGKVRF